MIITDSPERKPKKKRATLKNKKLIVLFILLLLFSSFLLVNHYATKSLQTKGYKSLFEFTKTVISNYWHGMDAKPENISIEIKERDFKILEKNRGQALKRNLIINNLDGDYVPATLEYKGKKLKIKLRLKGHMTDHLEENKWSFRIKVKDKDSFMGMKRFSIQQPGTRGYVYEWIYHQLMRNEGIIALRYKFINVTLNGRDWGIYAVEENFEKELIENNNRKPGPIIRFNPDLYWVNRYNMMLKQASSDEFASYYSANPEAYREDDVLSDSVQKKYFLKGMALVEGLRSKKLSVDQIFDVERLAKFHAIIDLVGGEHSIDWSDIKYYYNPVTEKLEPVAYESFTNLTVHEITGNYKYIILDSANRNYEDWHTAIFSNPVFYKLYVQNLERLSNPAYLDSFFASVKDELNANLNIIYKEFPYKKFDKEGYYRNQKMIKKILSPPKAIHVYFVNCTDNLLHLQIGAIESLPVEIKSIKIRDRIILPSSPIILPSKQQSEYVNYKNYSFTLPQDFKWEKEMEKSVIVNYSILGSSLVMKTNAFPYPHTDNEFIADELKNKQSTVSSFPFLKVDESNKNIFVEEGKHTISSDLVVPKGYKLVANTSITLDIKNNAKIISYSPLLFSGTDDENIIIESSDSSSQGIEVISSSLSKLNNVTFKNIPKIHDEQWARTGALTFYESPVEFTACNFYNSKAEDVVNLIRSQFSFKTCFFHSMRNDAIDADFSTGTISNCVFENCNENALDITMSNVTVKTIVIDGANNKAMNIKTGAKLTGDDVKIKKSNIAISAEDQSEVNLQNVTISDTETGITAYKNKSGAGYPLIKINGIKMEKVNKEYLRESKVNLIMNGKKVTDEVNDVESIIKRDKKSTK